MDTHTHTHTHKYTHTHTQVHVCVRVCLCVFVLCVCACVCIPGTWNQQSSSSIAQPASMGKQPAARLLIPATFAMRTKMDVWLPSRKAFLEKTLYGFT